MQLDQGSEKPIFIQLAESVEDNILKGIYEEETQIPSTTEVAVTLKVNPATVNHGVNLLVDEGIIYKKRGVGMFVNTGARQIILARRKEAFFRDYLFPMLEEAKKIGLTQDDVLKILNHPNNGENIERSNLNEHD